MSSFHQHKQLFFLIILLWMRPNQGFSQKEMVFLGHSQNGNQLNINYKIPYDGMIEIKFIHSDSKKTVWRNQYIRQLGERKETIDVSKFATKKPGNYQYLLCYKGKCLEKRINLP